jgi:hypothetical protein
MEIIFRSEIIFGFHVFIGMYLIMQTCDQKVGSVVN